MEAGGESPGPPAVPPDETAEDLYEHAPCGYLSTLPDGTIVRVNATLLAWTGHARDELVGRRFADLLTPGGRIYHETHYAPLLRMQGAVREIALELVRGDGRRLPVLVNSVLRTEADGTPRLVRTTVFDATDRRRYERELLRAREDERAARERADRTARRMAFLAGTSRALDERQTFAERARLLVERVVPELADWARIEGPPDQPAVVAERGDAPPSDARGVRDAVARALALGEAVVAPGGAYAALPLRARGRTLGALALACVAPARALRDDDLPFLADLADRAALALENARLYEREREVAGVLQRGLLAGEPPRDPRWGVAARYQPAVEALEVGGDWHDAFLVAPGRLALVVGDVVGRGIVAASAMGQLRSAVRALAGTGAGPAALLKRVDAFAARIEAAELATLAYAELDADTGALRLACAGHPPPAIVAPGEQPRLVWDGRSPPVGAAPAAGERVEALVELPPGARLLLYTDGLVERRGEPLDRGLDRLAAALDARREEPLERLADGLLAALLAGERRDDDVCLLCAERRAAG